LLFSHFCKLLFSLHSFFPALTHWLVGVEFYAPLDTVPSHTHACIQPVFIPDIFFLGGGQTNLVPQTAGKLCAVNLFFCQDDELPIYHGNFLVMGNKHRKLFVVKQSKCSKIRLAAGLCPDTLGELIHSPRPLAAIGVPTYKGRGGRQRGLFLRGTEGRGREFPPKSG